MRDLWTIGFLGVLSCATQQAKMLKTPEFVPGSLVELRQSSYYGELYDENELWLLSHVRFASRHDIDDLAGNPVNTDAREQGIIPAGTKFKIERLEEPTPLALTTRLLKTPRYNTWVYLTLADPNVRIANSKPFVLLLPGTSDDLTVMNKLLGKPGEVSAWLKERKPTIQSAIRYKKVQVGMTRDELLASQGEPERYIYNYIRKDASMVALYGQQKYVLNDERVVALEYAP